MKATAELQVIPPKCTPGWVNSYGINLANEVTTRMFNPGKSTLPLQHSFYEHGKRALIQPVLNLGLAADSWRLYD